MGIASGWINPKRPLSPSNSWALGTTKFHLLDEQVILAIVGRLGPSDRLAWCLMDRRLRDLVRSSFDTAAVVLRTPRQGSKGFIYHMERLSVVTAAFPFLTELDFAGVHIGDDGAVALAAGIACRGRLAYLDLDGHEISDVGARALARALAQNVGLSDVDLSNNYIEAAGVDMGEMLADNASIHTLDLHGNQLGDASAQKIGHGLTSNTTLTTLDLSRNHLGRRSSLALADGLLANGTLRHLSLADNHLGDAGKIIGAIGLSPSLHVLCLDRTAIGRRGGKQLGEMLERNGTLRVLHLSACEIGPPGATAIGLSLFRNTSLTELVMRDNEIGNAGMRPLLDALSMNSTLQHMDLAGNDATPACVDLMRDVLRRNTGLHFFSVADNLLGTGSAPRLASIFAFNRTLRTLDLSGSSIDFRGLHIILEGLRANRRLTRLHMADCDIPYADTLSSNDPRVVYTRPVDADPLGRRRKPEWPPRACAHRSLEEALEAASLARK